MIFHINLNIHVQQTAFVSCTVHINGERVSEVLLYTIKIYMIVNPLLLIGVSNGR
jgi:hypothetical protein